MAEYLLGLPLVFIIASVISYGLRNQDCPARIAATVTTVLSSTILLGDIYWDGHLGETVYAALGVLIVGYAITLLVWLHEKRDNGRFQNLDRAQLDSKR